jgi:hypothetical protein
MTIRTKKVNKLKGGKYTKKLVGGVNGHRGHGNVGTHNKAGRKEARAKAKIQKAEEVIKEKQVRRNKQTGAEGRGAVKQPTVRTLRRRQQSLQRRQTAQKQLNKNVGKIMSIYNSNPEANGSDTALFSKTLDYILSGTTPSQTIKDLPEKYKKLLTEVQNNKELRDLVKRNIIIIRSAEAGYQMATAGNQNQLLETKANRQFRGSQGHKVPQKRNPLYGKHNQHKSPTTNNKNPPPQTNSPPSTMRIRPPIPVPAESPARVTPEPGAGTGNTGYEAMYDAFVPGDRNTDAFVPGDRKTDTYTVMRTPTNEAILTGQGQGKEGTGKKGTGNLPQQVVVQGQPVPPHMNIGPNINGVKTNAGPAHLNTHMYYKHSLGNYETPVPQTGSQTSQPLYDSIPDGATKQMPGKPIHRIDTQFSRDLVISNNDLGNVSSLNAIGYDSLVEQKPINVVINVNSLVKCKIINLCNTYQYKTKDIEDTLKSVLSNIIRISNENNRMRNVYLLYSDENKNILDATLKKLHIAYTKMFNKLQVSFDSLKELNENDYYIYYDKSNPKKCKSPQDTNNYGGICINEKLEIQKINLGQKPMQEKEKQSNLEYNGDPLLGQAIPGEHGNTGYNQIQSTNPPQNGMPVHRAYSTLNGNFSAGLQRTGTKYNQLQTNPSAPANTQARSPSARIQQEPNRGKYSKPNPAAISFSDIPNALSALKTAIENSKSRTLKKKRGSQRGKLHKDCHDDGTKLKGYIKQLLDINSSILVAGVDYVVGCELANNVLELIKKIQNEITKLGDSEKNTKTKENYENQIKALQEQVFNLKTLTVDADNYEETLQKATEMQKQIADITEVTLKDVGNVIESLRDNLKLKGRKDKFSKTRKLGRNVTFADQKGVTTVARQTARQTASKPADVIEEALSGDKNVIYAKPAQILGVPGQRGTEYINAQGDVIQPPIPLRKPQIPPKDAPPKRHSIKRKRGTATTLSNTSTQRSKSHSNTGANAGANAAAKDPFPGGLVFVNAGSFRGSPE